MRGTKAKAIRRGVYGDLSLKNREYFKSNVSGMIRCDKLRTKYQIIKKLYKLTRQRRGA